MWHKKRQLIQSIFDPVHFESDNVIGVNAKLVECSFNGD